MQVLSDYVGTIAAWIVTLFMLMVVFKDRGQNTRLLKAWLFALSYSLLGTFEIDGVYLAVDRAVGVHNLSWLLSSLFLLLMVYFLCAICCSKQPRWMPRYLVITGCLLVIVFPFGPASNPESVHQVVPRDAAELLFVGLYYVYAIVMMRAIPNRAFRRAWRDENDHLVHLRTSVILLAVATAITFYVGRLAIWVVGFFVPLPMPFLLRAEDATSLVALIASMLWPLGFISNRFYSALARPVTFCRKLLILRDLKVLQTRLDRLCPPVAPLPPGQATWWEQLRNPDFYVYRRTIGILDGRKVLAACFEQWDTGTSDMHEGGPVGLPVYQGNPHAVGSLHWDGRDVEEAGRLHQALQSVPESLPFEGLVDGYRTLGRQWRSAS